jgi:type IV pilus assembly protein PilM
MMQSKKNKNMFSTHFPTPAFLKMSPVGIDISERVVRFVELVETKKGLEVGRYGKTVIPANVVSSGVVQDRDSLKMTLKKLKRNNNLNFVRASLPEERGYLYKTEARGTDDEEIKKDLEFHLEENAPVSPEEAVFDYEIVKNKNYKKGHPDVSVSVFSEKVVNSYVSIFQESGLIPISLEVEAHAIARAVVPKGDQRSYMIVDFGAMRSGLSIVSEGVLRFTSTLELGSDNLTESIKKSLSVSAEEAEEIKMEKGFSDLKGDEKLVGAIITTLSALKDEIKRHYTYWQSRGEENDPENKHKIDKLIFCGGGSAMPGLKEYMSLGLDVDVDIANVWTNVFSLDEYIPPITFRESLSYATAIGLALPRD